MLIFRLADGNFESRKCYWKSQGGVIEKNYDNHETHETFLYHWCEDQNLGNPLFIMSHFHTLSILCKNYVY